MDIDIYNPALYLDRDKQACSFIKGMLLDAEPSAAICMYGNGKDYLFQNLVREFSALQLPYTMKVINTLSEGELKLFADDLKNDKKPTICFVNLRVGKDVSWFITLLEELRIKRGNSFISFVASYVGDVYEALRTMNKVLVESLVILECVTYEDAMHIIDIEFSKRFNFHPTKEQKEDIYSWSYGHIALLKSLYLLKRAKPSEAFSRKSLVKNLSIVQRLKAIIDDMPEDMLQTVLGKKHNPLLYLYAEKIGYIKNGKLFHSLLEDFIPQMTKPHSVLFTTTELRVIDYLQQHKNELVKREDIAKAIWGEEDWEEKYSEWALGQLIYRIRKKLQRSSESVDIQTKKGEGFILVEML